MKTMDKIDLDGLLVAAEVAEMLRRTPQNIYQRVIAGTIPHIKIGGKILFEECEIQKMLSDGKEGYDD